MHMRFTAWLIVALCPVSAAMAGLSPNEVVVVANSASRDSVALARTYTRRRGIPQSNLVLLSTATAEEVSREVYDAQIRRPLAEALRQRSLAGKARCLCMMWGVPVRISATGRKLNDAAVDSELALLLSDRYKLEGHLPNPLHWQAKSRPKSTVLMTARLDGPSRADAARIIKASLAVEKKGLAGTFYIDAGGPHVEYDKQFMALHDMLRKDTRIKAVLEQSGKLFGPRSCPKAAMYVGWSSPRRYIPSMMWAPGAVGWHVAADEARDLRDAGSRRWCPRMIRDGAAVTLGAVADPTLGAFPSPRDFFALLLTGKYTVAECYWRTVGHTSWRMVLIADPLYNPFAANPQLKTDQLPRGLAP